MKHGKMSACTHRESHRRENKRMNGRPTVTGIWKARRERKQPWPGDVTHWRVWRMEEEATDGDWEPGESTCWEERSHPHGRTGASLSRLSWRRSLEQGLSCLELLLQGHVNLCYNAWRWLLQSHFIYGGFIGRGVGVQYNFSPSDVSISLTSHLHF